MRLLILTPFESLDAERDVLILQARGYEAVSYYGLYAAEYRLNRGLKVPVGMAHINLLAELCEGTIPVIHPESRRELVEQVAEVCRFAHVPLLHWEDLPACPPVSQEVLDALNCAAAPVWPQAYCEVPTVALSNKRSPVGRLMDRLSTVLTRMDAKLDWMKNPMAREQRAAVREYGDGGVPVATTG